MRLAPKLVLLAAVTAAAQTPAPPASPIAFDTISVKQNKTNDSHPGSMLRPDGFDAENVTPSWVMNWAFLRGAHAKPHFSGLPGWASTEHYDIIAKVAGADFPVWDHMSDAGRQQMICDLFGDRFKLRTHIETEEQPIYALVIAKSGAKLTPAKPLPERFTTPAANGFVVRPTDGLFGFSRTGVIAENMTMEEFAGNLSSLNLGLPVQDRTGLSGRYDLKLDFSQAPASTAPSAETAAPAPQDFPDIFAAIQQQLGLKLEPAKGPVETIVIDHMERPSEN
jgi:uncharacterized protein (TIGR03435 family)